MNIYIFDEYLSSQKNGIGTYLRELLFCLKQNKWDLTIIVFNAKVEEFTIIREEGIKKILFPTLQNGFFLDYGYITNKLLKLYLEDSPKNIFFINHAPCGKFLESLKINFPLSKRCYTIHDFTWLMPLMGDIRKYKKLIRNNNAIMQLYKEDKRIYGLADKIICLSNDTHNILRQLYKVPSAKLAYIPNGLRRARNIFSNENVKKIRRNLQIRDDEKILLFVGRLTKQKGVFDLISAMDIVLKYYPNTRLVIVGEYEISMKEILNASSSNLGHITFTGHLDKPILKRWFSVSDIGIIPSYYEQCSYTAIEMMMYGLPIIASNGFGIKNMLQDDINAKIGDRKHPEEFQKNLATSIMKLLNSEELRKKISINLRKRYQNEYTIKYMKELYVKLIKELCSK